MDLAAVRRPDRRDDLVGLGVLEQVPGGSRLQRRVYPLGLAEAGQRDHLNVRVKVLDGGGGRDAVEARHEEVHEHDVGQVVAGREDGEFVERGPPVPGLAEHLDVVEHLEERAHAAADHRVVVDRVPAVRAREDHEAVDRLVGRRLIAAAGLARSAFGRGRVRERD